MTGHDDDGGTITYSATGLPAGLSISSAGLISGTSSAGSAAGGPYNVTVFATDSTYTATDNFTWTVMPQVSLHWHRRLTSQAIMCPSRWADRTVSAQR